MAMTSNKSDSRLSWILFGSLVLIYGSAFILIKWGLISYSPQQVASYRIFIGALVLSPFAVGIRKFNLTKTQWYFLLQSGILGSLIPAFLFASAEEHLDSGIASVLGSMTPVFTVLISHFAFRYKLGKFQIPGLLLAFGSALLIGLKDSSGFDFQWKGVVYILIATLCYAANMNFIKYKLEDISPKVISSISLLFLIIPTGFFLFQSNFFEGVQNPENLKSLISISILGLTSTALALILFIKLLKMANPVFTSSITFAIPLVAILWGVFDGEKVGIQEAIAIGLMLLGIWLISKKE
jgi:drug/metabolite transporter (DMT)-like permease